MAEYSTNVTVRIEIPPTRATAITHSGKDLDVTVIGFSYELPYDRASLPTPHLLGHRIKKDGTPYQFPDTVNLYGSENKWPQFVIDEMLKAIKEGPVLR